MTIETLVVACILLGIGYVIVRYLVPEPVKQIGYWILLGIAVVWVVTHLRALMHLQLG